MNNLVYVNGKTMKQNSKSNLDQYFTKSEIAEHLYSVARNVISKFENNIEKFT
jgi:hypothetical protein